MDADVADRREAGQCGNLSCDRDLPANYHRQENQPRWFCSRDCQTAARNPDGYVRVSVPVPMSVWHRLVALAESESTTVAVLVADEAAQLSALADTL